MYLTILRDLLICIPAAFFFSILFSVPKKAILVSALLGAVGYAVYEGTSPLIGSPIAGYFIGTLFMAVSSELLARWMKMPATVFVLPAIIPLVPGVGLYNTMFYLVSGHNTQAGRTGAATLLEIVAMAMALVLTSIFSKGLSACLRSGHRRGEPPA